MALAVVGVIVSMLIIWRACDAFEASTSYLGRNMNDGVRGATLNAIGSSLPELLTASLALLFYVDKEGFAFGVGTTAGSAVFNSAVIPAMVVITVVGFARITNSIQVSRKVVLRDGLTLLAMEAVLICLLSRDPLTWVDGLILLAMYAAYIFGMLYGMRKNEGAEEEYEDDPESGENRLTSLFSVNLRNAFLGNKIMSKNNSCFLLMISTLAIGGACHLLVESCYVIGDSFGIRTYFVAVILAAAATSVPDTIISIKDAKKGEYDDAVSNALGSNIFDICVCLGLPLFMFSLFTGQSISLGADQENVADLRIMLLAITAAVFLILLIGKNIGKLKGVMMLSLYIAFVSYIISQV